MKITRTARPEMRGSNRAPTTAPARTPSATGDGDPRVHVAAREVDPGGSGRGHPDHEVAGRRADLHRQTHRRVHGEDLERARPDADQARDQRPRPTSARTRAALPRRRSGRTARAAGPGRSRRAEPRMRSPRCRPRGALLRRGAAAAWAAEASRMIPRRRNRRVGRDDACEERAHDRPGGRRQLEEHADAHVGQAVADVGGRGARARGDDG